MMEAILNSAILDSDTLFSSLRFTQKHSLSPLWLWLKLINLTQPQSFSLNLMMAAILNAANLHSAILVFPLKLTHTCQDWFPPFAQKKTSRIHSDSTLWWQPSWILPCWNQTLSSCIQTPSYLLWDLLKNTLSLLRIWLKLINLTQPQSFSLNLMMAAILNSANLHSAILVFPLKLTHTYQDWFPLFASKKPWLIHSDSTWWLQLSWILPSLFQPFCTKKTFTHSFSLNLMMAAILISAIMDSAILHKKNFTHSFSLNLMMAAILKSAILDSDTAILDSNTLLYSLRFTQKHSHSILNMTQTNSIWLKLIHSHLTRWWQPSWILPSSIWPSWIQPS